MQSYENKLRSFYHDVIYKKGGKIIHSVNKARYFHLKFKYFGQAPFHSFLNVFSCSINNVFSIHHTPECTWLMAIWGSSREMTNRAKGVICTNRTVLMCKAKTYM